VPQVVILTLKDPAAHGCGDEGCACGLDRIRVPVLTCADALKAAGATVELVTARSEAELDAATKPVEAGDARLVVAAATDSEIRGVLRRLTRRYAPPPSKRPADLPPHRTMFDLPPIAILPLQPAVPPLVRELGLPTDPAEVATATVEGHVRRMDLLRNDGGSVTVHGALLGGFDDGGQARPFRGRIEVDDHVLSTGDEPVLACSIRNVGASDVDGLPLVTQARIDGGLVEVAVAVPLLMRRLIRPAAAQVEVRRARGRATSVTIRDDEVRCVDDGVVSALNRKRSWWTERGAWAAYVV